MIERNVNSAFGRKSLSWRREREDKEDGFKWLEREESETFEWFVFFFEIFCQNFAWVLIFVYVFIAILPTKTTHSHPKQPYSESLA